MLAKASQVMRLFFALCVMTCTTSHVPHATPSHFTCEACARLARPVKAAPSLPPGLTLPRLDTTLHLVSLIATDFDADGDLDIVGDDDSLVLFVWVNDGTGHLTRKPPAQGRGWQPTPAAPSLTDHKSGSLVSIQSRGAPIDANSRQTKTVFAVRPFGARHLAPVASALRRQLHARSPPASPVLI